MGSLLQTVQVYQTSLVSLADIIMAQEQQEFDTLSLRNRDVVETFSPVSALGQEKKKEFDELELRNRTVTETLSPLEDLGQDPKVENGAAKKDDAGEKKVEENTKYDELELRNRTVVETLSPLDELGQDKKVETRMANPRTEIKNQSSTHWS